ncbi:hypothetical protein FOZ61_008348 [Perkinsus olseni]|uniref:Uncharacterized protein n=1 Tax=Perkinsus olseni TaxID=32597 RepID=A0A7J6LDC1_PEROL|nr:hypothetical protein FOZ61_008348 [Perkinsus olseni]KAF4657176.1 hypothetical protein FOL46_007518 [Perkinsus olseni]
MAVELIAKSSRGSISCSIWSFLYVVFLVLFAAFAIYSAVYTSVHAQESIVTHVSPQQLMDLAESLGVAIFLPINPVRASWVLAIVLGVLVPFAAIFGITYHCSSTARKRKPWKYLVGGSFWGLLLLTFVGALLVGGTGIGMSVIGKLSMNELQREASGVNKYPELALGLITLKLIRDYSITIPVGELEKAVERYTDARCTAFPVGVTCSRPLINEIRCSGVDAGDFSDIITAVCSTVPSVEGFAPQRRHCAACLELVGVSAASNLRVWLQAISEEDQRQWMIIGVQNAMISGVALITLIWWTIWQIWHRRDHQEGGWHRKLSSTA